MFFSLSSSYVHDPFLLPLHGVCPWLQFLVLDGFCRCASGLSSSGVQDTVLNTPLCSSLSKNRGARQAWKRESPDAVQPWRSVVLNPDLQSLSQRKMCPCHVKPEGPVSLLRHLVCLLSSVASIKFSLP